MKLKFSLIQDNYFVGNFTYNYNKISSAIKNSIKQKTDIIVFPELAITGYPPEDLLYKRRFIQGNIRILKKIAGLCKNIICIIGFVHEEKGELFNSAAVIYNQKIIYIYKKINLPNYSVFDEKRYFSSGHKVPIIEINNIRFGINICEDLWVEQSPALIQSQNNTDFIININASPYYRNKKKDRIRLLKKLAKRYNNHIFYLNLIGAQDEIIFDGNSMVANQKGEIIAHAGEFIEKHIKIQVDFKEREKKEIVDNNIVLIKIDKYKSYSKNTKRIKTIKNPFLTEEAEIYRALVLGTSDYIHKNNFGKVIIGLSGGIDSALTTVIAVDAIDRKNVETLFMPSRYSSKQSLKDATDLAGNLNVKLNIVPIEEIYKSYLEIMEPYFKNNPFNIAEENIQARIRGNILMAFSNKFGHLVLTTGNKSEMSTGYATLYGDMAGGFAVLKDVYKTLVFKLSKYRNKIEGKRLIPISIINKPPTAELRENQKDSDSLPSYSILDKILYLYIEKHMTFHEINKLKQFDEFIIKKVINLVDYSEYKRRQAPPGVKITKLSFGKDRRMPISCGYMLR